MLLATANDYNFQSLPTRFSFDAPSIFGYNFKTLDLKIIARTITGEHEVGTARFSLSDYSSDTYPTPKDLFFNQNNCAGTLELSYTY